MHREPPSVINTQAKSRFLSGPGRLGGNPSSPHAFHRTAHCCGYKGRNKAKPEKLQQMVKTVNVSRLSQEHQLSPIVASSTHTHTHIYTQLEFGSPLHYWFSYVLISLPLCQNKRSAHLSGDRNELHHTDTL